MGEKLDLVSDMTKVLTTQARRKPSVVTKGKKNNVDQEIDPATKKNNIKICTTNYITKKINVNLHLVVYMLNTSFDMGKKLDLVYARLQPLNFHFA